MQLLDGQIDVGAVETLGFLLGCQAQEHHRGIRIGRGGQRFGGQLLGVTHRVLAGAVANLIQRHVHPGRIHVRTAAALKPRRYRESADDRDRRRGERQQVMVVFEQDDAFSSRLSEQGAVFRLILCAFG